MIGVSISLLLLLLRLKICTLFLVLIGFLRSWRERRRGVLSLMSMLTFLLLLAGRIVVAVSMAMTVSIVLVGVVVVGL